MQRIGCSQSDVYFGKTTHLGVCAMESVVGELGCGIRASIKGSVGTEPRDGWKVAVRLLVRVWRNAIAIIFRMEEDERDVEVSSDKLEVGSDCGACGGKRVGVVDGVTRSTDQQRRHLL